MVGSTHEQSHKNSIAESCRYWEFCLLSLVSEELIKTHKFNTMMLGGPGSEVSMNMYYGFAFMTEQYM